MVNFSRWKAEAKELFLPFVFSSFILFFFGSKLEVKIAFVGNIEKYLQNHKICF